MTTQGMGLDSGGAALSREVRYAARALRHSPGFTVVVVVTIAISVAAATSMFGLMRRLVLAPPPNVASPDRVLRLHQVLAREDGSDEVFASTSYPFFELLKNRAMSVDAVAAYRRADLPVGSGDEARLAQVRMVSAGFWRALGPRPALGRFIEDPEADPVTGSRVAVLGFAFWQRELGGRANVLGTTLRIKGHPYDVIGVAPPGFRGIDLADVDVWLPLFAAGDGSNQPVTWHIPKTSFDLTILVRLRPGVAREQAAGEFTALYRAFLEDAYGSGGSSRDQALRDRNRRARTVLGPVTGGLGADLHLLPEARITVWLVGIAVVLLTIACSNVASLLLLRAVRRRREFAVRLALGVSRARLALQLLTESAALTLMGGFSALLLVRWSRAWVQATILPAIGSQPVDLGEFGVMSLAVLGASLLTFAAGLTPLWYARTHSIAALCDIVRAPGKRPPVLTALLLTQVALTVVLLVGAGLFLRSLHNARTEDVGLSRDDTLVVQVDFASTGRSAAAVSAFFEAALARARTIPGVTQASLATDAPLRSARVTGALRLPGQTDMPVFSTGGPYVNAVSPGFFATAGMRLREGRDFVDRDRSDGMAMVVNETLAKAFWPTGSAVGQCLVRERQQNCIPVVGVVSDSRRFNLIENERFAYYYVVLMPANALSRVLLVRKTASAEGVETALRRLLLDLDAALPYARIEPLGQALEPQIRRWRLGASVLTALGLLAVTLALVGLLSSVSYDASRRTRELATRMALGATRPTLVWMMLRSGLLRVSIGLAAGLGLALSAGGYVADLLYRVSPRDSRVLILVSPVALTIGACASIVPAWKISRIDPASALRTE